MKPPLALAGLLAVASLSSARARPWLHGPQRAARPLASALGCVLWLVALVAALLTFAPAARAAGCDPAVSCCIDPNPAGSPCTGSGDATTQPTAAVSVGAGNPINLLSGNKYQREVDLPALPGVLGLELVRHYNSALPASLNATGSLGPHWTLSYDTRLVPHGHRLMIQQADGSTLAFARSMVEPATFQGAEPAFGVVHEARRAMQGGAASATPAWRWTRRDGRRLDFDAAGRLVQITAPTGEFVDLQHDAAGRLVKVTDPQGRSLVLHYADPGARTATATLDRRVRAIDTPVGRFHYGYAASRPAAAEPGAPGPLVTVQMPAKAGLPAESRPAVAGESSSASAGSGSTASAADATAPAVLQPGQVRRRYHYEDPRFATHLTGISVEQRRATGTATGGDGSGSSGELGSGSSTSTADADITSERIATYAYDERGRANLSVKGEPARLATDAAGAVLSPPRLAPGTGLEQITLETPDRSTTVLRNSEGAQTTYRHGLVAGERRLLEVRGPGCATCGPTDRRYDYDTLGRLVATTRLDAAGQPLETLTRTLDREGRVVALARMPYADGRPGPRTPLARYEYGARGAAQDQPTLVARPSVVAGRERLIETRYNEHGQPLERIERGFSPLDDAGRPAPDGHPIERRTLYRYALVNGRSVLAEIDGPLANGPTGSPADSDITRFQWDERGNAVQAVTAPADLETHYRYDDLTARVIERVDSAGVATRYAYDEPAVAQPSTVERAGQITRFGFDAQGRVVQVADAPDRAIALRYDTAGRLASVVDAQGYKAEVTLDTEGQARVAGLYEPRQDAPLRATYRWFDERRRLVRQLRPDGRLDSWTYDGKGQVTQHLDGDDVLHLQRLHDDAQLDLELAPDGMTRLALHTTASARPSAAAPQERRDDFGRLVQQWRPEQGLSVTEFDATGRLLVQLHYDRLGQLVARIEQRWDAAGRLLERRSIDLPGHVTSTLVRRYQGPHLVEERDDAQHARYTYDAGGRLIATETTLLDDNGQPVFGTRLAIQYDTTGAPLARTLADGRVMRMERGASGATARRLTLQTAFWAKVHDRLAQWLPDTPARRLQRSLPAEEVVSDLGFHPYDGIRGYTHGNGARTDLGFDIAGRQTLRKVGLAGAAIETHLRYGIGPRVREIQTAGDAQTQMRYEYDGFGALRPAPLAQATRTVPAGPPPRFDGRGRVAFDGRYTYRYTVRGQIDEVQQAGRTIAKYRYNGAGQRVSKTVHGETTYYLWSERRLVAEIDASGDIQVQYLYLGQEGRLAPIAKLESARAPGNATGRERTLYIHSDHRGAPIAMSDDRQRIVWRAHPDEWGYVSVHDLKPAQAQLNLRLPGQYHDEETGLHDNWHRTYDARPGSVLRGRYFSPDPLGYVDGPDPYRYAGGDPINKIDPTGLYQEDIHYYMTFFLALAAGVPYDTARTIALAAQYVDDNPDTKPLNVHAWDFLTGAPEHNRRLLTYHFTMWTGSIDDPVFDTSTEIENPDARSDQLQNLFWTSMRGPTPCARYQLFGEYLHAFQDTFSHRDNQNRPFGNNGGMGHGLQFSEPDYTYDDLADPNDPAVAARGYFNRESRTLQMERETFIKLTGFSQGEVREFSDFEGLLRQFNATRESGSGLEDFDKKIELLQGQLDAWGITDANGQRVVLDDSKLGGYNRNVAGENRNRNLCRSAGGLNQSDYLGTILPAC